MPGIVAGTALKLGRTVYTGRTWVLRLLLPAAPSCRGMAVERERRREGEGETDPHGQILTKHRKT